MERKIVLGFGLALAALLLNFFYSVQSTRKLIKNRSTVTHSHRILSALEMILSSLYQAETGQRGYLLIGKDEYLEPFNAAVRDLPRTLKDLHDRTAQQPWSPPYCSPAWSSGPHGAPTRRHPPRPAIASAPTSSSSPRRRSKTCG